MATCKDCSNSSSKGWLWGHWYCVLDGKWRDITETIDREGMEKCPYFNKKGE